MASFRYRRTLPSAPVLALVALVAGWACGEDRSPIVIERHQVTIENQTRHRWSNVEIWLNDHYRVTAPTLEPGGRLNVPLDTFVAGFGQRFDRRRQTPSGIEVTARTDAGETIRLLWGKGRRR